MSPSADARNGYTVNPTLPALLTQACRLPYKLNGIVVDNEICPNSTRVTPVYVNSATTSERAIGSLITFRTAAGWLVATVRLDCPWLMWFSYNGKMPSMSVVGNTTSSSITGRRRRLTGSLFTSGHDRGLRARSGTTTDMCPSLTTDGSILYGNGNGQYQNGRPDVRSFISLTYTSSKGTVVEQIPMFRYQVRTRHRACPCQRFAK
jgi:hypothetical protein